MILAELPEAVEHAARTCAARAAVSADVRHLMDALPPLARVARYGDVRGTKAERRAAGRMTALFERVVVGLPGACASLDDDAANGDGREHGARATRAWTCCNRRLGSARSGCARCAG